MKSQILISFIFTLTLISCNHLENNQTTSDNSSLSENLASSDNYDVSSSSISSYDDIIDDPYEGISLNQFYSAYSPATSYMDSVYRTKHHLMSGSIGPQKQRPTIVSNQPNKNGKLLFNSSSGLNKEETIYEIVDKNGNVINTIYKGGAYVILEEVAAYVYAFGDVPPNYTNSKKASPSNSPWGKYLRLNHSYFSCDTDKYKYEPELPDLDSKVYYEIDIGTTGSYEYSTVSKKGEYNDGSQIIRGASRIVYTRYSKGNKPTSLSDRKVFYTFNHYNDFQEYLNYENGWGKWFGNIAGGGKMDNNTSQYKTYAELISRL